MTRFDWLKKHEVHMEQGDIAGLMEDHAYCKARRDLAPRSPMRKAWEDRRRAIERRLRELETGKGE